MPNDDENGLDEPQFTSDPTSDKNATLKDLEIAMLRSTGHLKKHITAEVKDLKACNNEKFEKIEGRCMEHHDGIKKNAANHRTLVILLIAGGTLGGSGLGYGAMKLVNAIAGG